jgi:hypothetical protein
VDDSTWRARGQLVGDGFHVRDVGLERKSSRAKHREQMTADEALSACDEDRAAHRARP